MSTNHRIISASGRLLAIAFATLLSGRLSAGEDDAMAEKAIQALGGEVIRSPDAPGKPIISVDFNATQVTDAGLKELANLKNLSRLNLMNTQVTDAGVRELQKALPKCVIDQ